MTELIPFLWLYGPALVAMLLPYRLAKGVAIAAATLGIAGPVLNVGLCLAVASAGGGCSGVPAGVLLMYLMPIFVGAFLGMAFRAWRGLRGVDLRARPGWQRPHPAVRWAYVTCLALVLWGNWPLLSSTLRRVNVDMANVSILMSYIYSFSVPVLVTALGCWRVIRLALDADALWAPEKVRLGVAIGVGLLWVQVASQYLHVVSPVLGSLGRLMSTFGFVFLLLGVALIEFRRFGQLLQEQQEHRERGGGASEFPATRPLTAA